jgi:hypothetical protein
VAENQWSCKPQFFPHDNEKIKITNRKYRKREIEKLQKERGTEDITY